MLIFNSHLHIFDKSINEGIRRISTSNKSNNTGFFSSLFDKEVRKKIPI